MVNQIRREIFAHNKPKELVSQLEQINKYKQTLQSNMKAIAESLGLQRNINPQIVKNKVAMVKRNEKVYSQRLGKVKDDLRNQKMTIEEQEEALQLLRWFSQIIQRGIDQGKDATSSIFLKLGQIHENVTSFFTKRKQKENSDD